MRSLRWTVVHFLHSLFSSNHPLLQLVHLIKLGSGYGSVVISMPLHFLFCAYTELAIICIRTIHNTCFLLSHWLIFRKGCLSALILFTRVFLSLLMIATLIFFKKIFHIFNLNSFFLFCEVARLSALCSF